MALLGFQFILGLEFHFDPTLAIGKKSGKMEKETGWN